MKAEMRKSGVDVVGDVPWGTHFCLFYEGHADLLETLVCYIKTGLENQEFCLWAVAAPLTVEDATHALKQAIPDFDRYLNDHSIEIASTRDWYLQNGAFDLNRVIRGWNEKLAGALARGYAGLRVTGDTAWLEKKGWKTFCEYEEAINQRIASQRLAVLCTYPLAAFGATEILDVVSTHQFAVTNRRGTWQVIETAGHKQAKAEIKRLNEELEQRVVDRTNQLTAANKELAKKVLERQNAEEALRRSEQRLRDVIETIPAMAWTALPDGSVDFVSRSWLDYTGFSMKDWLGSGWKTVAHPKDLGTIAEKWQAALEAAEPYECEVRTRTASGSYRWCLSRAVPLRDEFGKIVKWYGTNTDIDDLKRVESLLSAEKRTFEMIASGASLTDILENLCNAIDAQTPAAISTVLLMDPDGKRLWPAAGPKAPSGWAAAIAGGAIGPRAGSCGTAAFLKRLVITSDIASDPLWVDYRDLALGYGLRASWSEPLISKDRGVVGTFALYYAEPRTPTRSDLELIEGAGQIALIAIERKWAEAKLRENEQSLRLIVDGIAGIVAILAPTGEAEFVNNQALEYFGKTVEELKAWGTSDVVHPEDLPQAAAAWKHSVETGAPYDVDHRLRRADGAYLWFHSRSLALQDANGRIVRWYNLLTDIDERKRAEEKLRRSEAFLAEAQSISRTGSFGWNVSSGEIFWSDETFRIFEFDRAIQPTLELVLRRVHPDDRRLVEQAVGRASEAKDNLDFENRLLMPDGSVKHLHILARALETSSGHLEYVGAVMDLTAAKHAEDRLRHSEESLLEGQRLSHTGSFRHDISTGKAIVSPEVYRIYGIHPEDDASNMEFFFRMVHPEDRKRVVELFERAEIEKSDFQVDNRIVLPDGTIKHLHTIGHPVLNGSGYLEEYVGTTMDVTEHWQARAKLEKAFEEIQRLKEQLQNENVALREEIDKASMFEEIVGTSPPLHTVLARISKVAPSDSSVLITGETGTGKELVARAIHRRSRRSKHAFVSVNCAAIPPDLIASELFGHEKGAFTGATQRRVGRFELAEAGTIFLDEIGELPAETQIALLRVLQEREFERVGGTGSIRTNVRVIAATNRDLDAAVAAGMFRSDLFYRLNVFPIEIPPLRQRREDIPLLVGYFIDRFAKNAGKRFQAVNKKSLDLLQSYPWPGNIRELQNVIERSVIVCETENFAVDGSWLSRPPVGTDLHRGPGPFQKRPAEEKAIIEAALRESGGQVYGPSGAALKLGIPRSTLESKIRSLKIDKNRFRTTDSARIS